MSLYKQGITGVETDTNRGPAVVIIPKEKAEDNFWTAIKWIGAAITIVVGYREVKELYRTHLRRQDDEEAAEEAIAEETLKERD